MKQQTFDYLCPAILVVSLLIALALRLPGLNQSLWLDEAIQAHTALNLSLSNLLTQYLPQDFNPPLFYLITWLFGKVFGSSEIALRLPSLFAGLGIVALGYRFLMKFPDTKDKAFTVITGTLLLATAPLLVYYSQEARAYELAALLGMWSMVTFYETFFQKKNTYVEYCAVTLLMFLTHYAVWFLYPVQLVVLLLTAKFKANWQKVLLPVIGCVILVPLLLSQLKLGAETSSSLPVWKALGTASVKQLFLIPVKILVGRLPVEANAAFGAFLGALLVVWTLASSQALLIPADVRSSTLTKGKRIRTWLETHQEGLMLATWLVLPVLIGLFLSLKVSLFSYFRFLYIVPAFYLLLTLGINKLQPYWRYSVVILFLLLNGVTSTSYVTNSAYHREDWKGLVAYINHQPLTDPVVIIGAVSRPFWYYDQDHHQIIDYSQIDKVRFATSIWLITYGQPIFEPENSTYKKLTQDYGFIEIEEKQFRGDVIVKYLVNPSGLTAYKE